MVTRLGMAPRAAGMSCAAFQAHWRTVHAALAGGLPGVRAYLQHHAILAAGLPLLPYAGFDACAELDFDDAATMEAAFASEHYTVTVKGDERAMIDRARGGFAMMHRRVLGEDAGHGPAAVALMTFWRVHPRSTLARLDRGLGDEYRDLVGQAGALSHAQLVLDPTAHDGAVPAVYDAVDQLTFDGVERARAHLAGPVAHDAARALAGVGQAAGHVIARTVPVIPRPRNPVP